MRLPAIHVRSVIIGAVAVLIAILMGLWMFIDLFSPSAEDVIPAGRTAAFVKNANQDTLSFLLPLFPSLKSVPVQEEEFDLAVLSSPGGYEWAVFTGPRKQWRKAYSSKAVEELLARPASSPLSSFPPFATLRKESEKNAPWIYIDLRGSAISQTASDGLIEKYPHALIVPGTDRTRISLFMGSGTKLPLATAPSPPRLSPTPAFSASISAPVSMILPRIPDFLPIQSKFMLLGSLRREALAALGEDVSLAYDLGPLLRRQSVLAIGSGAMPNFYLSGTEDSSVIRKSLDRIHESVRRNASANIVKRRSLERGYVSATIRHDPSLIEDGRETRGSWDLRRTGSTTESGGIVSAVNQNKFVLSNNEEWALQGMANQSIDLSFAHGIPVAGGEALRPFLENIFQSALPSLRLEALFPLIFPVGDKLYWSLGLNSHTATFTLEAPKD